MEGGLCVLLPVSVDSLGALTGTANSSELGDAVNSFIRAVSGTSDRVEVALEFCASALLAAPSFTADRRRGCRALLPTSLSLIFTSDVLWILFCFVLLLVYILKGQASVRTSTYKVLSVTNIAGSRRRPIQYRKFSLLVINFWFKFHPKHVLLCY